MIISMKISTGIMINKIINIYLLALWHSNSNLLQYLSYFIIT